MRNFFVLAIALMATSPVFSQVRPTKAQLADRNFAASLQQSLPSVAEWRGNQQLILQYPNAGSNPTYKSLDFRRNRLTDMPANYAPPTPALPEMNVSIKDGDIFLQTAGQTRQLTKTEAREVNPGLSPDRAYVAFTRDNDLYTLNIATGKESRITTDGSDLILNGYSSWVYWEEIFGRSTRFRAFWWSPDSKHLAFMRFDQSMVAMFPLYVADGSHGYIEETRYPKAGDDNPTAKLGFTSPEGGSIRWADFNAANDHQLGWPEWTPDSKSLYVQWQNREQDSLIMYAVNPVDASKKPVYTEVQSSWTNLDEADDRLTFVNNGKQMIIRSDASGWKQLYLYTIDGNKVSDITRGGFTVNNVLHIDEKAQRVYYIARGLDNSALNQLCVSSFDGKYFRIISPKNMNVDGRVNISPDNKAFLISYSNVETPRTMGLFDDQGKLLHDFGKSTTPEYDKYEFAKTEIIRIPSADGKYQLPALITWPVDYEPGKKYPMMVSVYGGPDATNVRDNWSFNARRQYYAQEGLLQVSFDNRASGHFGKKAIAEIHRQMGIHEIEDFKTMAKYFIDRGIADPERIGISGFSFGGYMSAMALTYAADVFTHGIAGGSVTDWHLYDTHYTERYMDKPQINAEGYKKTSVMEYADRYKGKLLIVHGTMDDNVHMQNSIQLIGALQDAGKSFELMLYPNGRHGWGNLPARNRHYQNLQTRFIYDNLLRKEAPADMLY